MANEGGGREGLGIESAKDQYVCAGLETTPSMNGRVKKSGNVTSFSSVVVRRHWRSEVTENTRCFVVVVFLSLSLGEFEGCPIARMKNARFTRKEVLQTS